MTPEEVQRLEKAELDLAVARAMGKDIVLFPDNKFGIKVYNRKGVWVDIDHYSPSTNWAQGGPLIKWFIEQSKNTSLHIHIKSDGWITFSCDNAAVGDYLYLVALCRAYVLAKGE